MRCKSKMLFIGLVLCLFSLACVDRAAAQEPGPTGDAGAPTQITDSFPDPPVKWAAALPSLGYPTHAGNVVPAIVIRGNVIYVPGDNTLTALGGPTGKKLWTYNPGSGLSLTQLEVADNTVILAFAFTGDLVPAGGVPQAYIAGVDALTGQERWTYTTHESSITAWSDSDDTVYLAGSSGSLYGLKVATGELEWSMRSPNGDYIADIAAQDGILYLLGTHLDQSQNEIYSVYAVDARSKQGRWSLAVPGVDDIGAGFPSIRPAGTSIYVTGVHSLYALEEATGRIKWNYTPGPYKTGEHQPYPAIRTSPAFTGDTVYLGVALAGDTQTECYDSLASSVLGLDAATGLEKWQVRTEKSIDIGESLAVQGGTVYYTSSAVCGVGYTLYSDLYAMDVNSRSIIWRKYSGPGSYFVQPLVVADGTLLAGSVRRSNNVDYDLLYAIPTTMAGVGMPRAGTANLSSQLVALIAFFGVIAGATLLHVGKLYPQKRMPD
ncbi:MAG: PQQ-binding-like beta-propeller repeat protein [Chloroflexota bacterium]